MKLSTLPPENADPRSAPAQKILSPAPVMTTERTLSSSTNAPRAASSSWTSASLMALAGGRFSVMTAKPSPRSTRSVSYAIHGHSSQEDGGDGVRSVGQPIFALPQHPRRRHLVHRPEENFGCDLEGQVAPDRSGDLALLEDRSDQLEIRRYLVRGRAAKELVPLPELHLHDLGKRRIVLEHAQVQREQPADLRQRVRLAG